MLVSREVLGRLRVPNFCRINCKAAVLSDSWPTALTHRMRRGSFCRDGAGKNFPSLSFGKAKCAPNPECASGPAPAQATAGRAAGSCEVRPRRQLADDAEPCRDSLIEFNEKDETDVYQQPFGLTG